MDWRLAMRSAQLAMMAQAAALFQRDLRKADCLIEEARGLALQRPHPSENLSWLVVQRATASRIVMVSALLMVVTAMALVTALRLATALVSMLV